MFELVKAGGWVMIPIILCSITAMAIIVERFWTLRRNKIIPPEMVNPSSQLWQLAEINSFDQVTVHRIRMSSPLGEIIAAGIANSGKGRAVMKECIEDVGRQVAHELEHFLNALGTIASVSPLLGLLGTVSGMIKVFANIGTQGAGSPDILAGGISEALVATAAGLIVAIPSLAFYRYFERLVDDYVMVMETIALKLVDVMHGEKEIRP